jgi:hypothetical protein
MDGNNWRVILQVSRSYKWGWKWILLLIQSFFFFLKYNGGKRKLIQYSHKPSKYISHKPSKYNGVYWSRIFFSHFLCNMFSDYISRHIQNIAQASHQRTTFAGTCLFLGHKSLVYIIPCIFNMWGKWMGPSHIYGPIEVRIPRCHLQAVVLVSYIDSSLLLQALKGRIIFHEL